MKLQEKYALKVAGYLLVWMLPLFLLPFESQESFRIGIIMWFWSAVGGALFVPMLWKFQLEKSLPGIMKSMFGAATEEEV